MRRHSRVPGWPSCLHRHALQLRADQCACSYPRQVAHRYSKNNNGMSASARKAFSTQRNPRCNAKAGQHCATQKQQGKGGQLPGCHSTCQPRHRQQKQSIARPVMQRRRIRDTGVVHDVEWLGLPGTTYGNRDRQQDGNQSKLDDGKQNSHSPDDLRTSPTRQHCNALAAHHVGPLNTGPIPRTHRHHVTPIPPQPYESNAP